MNRRVFVYGTLMRGQRNDHYMQGARFLGRHRTEDIYSMFEFGGFPAVCADGRHAIEGELYLVSGRQFKRLDELEFYPHFYQRIEIPTRYGDAWMYTVRVEQCRGKRLIPGNWR